MKRPGKGEEMALSQESQEQQEPMQPEQQEEQQGTQAPTQASVPKGKRRVVKKLTEAEVEALSPRPSYWPLALAFAIVVFLYGAIGNEYIMGAGAVLVVIAVMGWGLERR
jgi:hypothetical protein